MDHRTTSSLDWDLIRQHLAERAATARGRAMAAELDLAPSAAAVLERYAAVSELRALDEQALTLPLGGICEIGPLVSVAARGICLEAEDLREIGGCLAALARLRRWIDARELPLPRLVALAEPIELPGALVSDLERAFDEAGGLCGERYPHLARLRGRVGSLRGRIRSRLEELLRGDALKGALRDGYVTEREGRFVLPIRVGSHRGVGIVHGASQSGETLFVEPHAVIEQTNDLKASRAELARAERAVLAALSRQVADAAESITQAAAAATALDVAQARTTLGDDLRGAVPEVGESGVLRLTAARHPLLELRGIAVVPNDLRLDGGRPGLVLTGPNAGGKTVALKTIGLAALLVRAGVPVPADDGGRVDFFEPVLADVGDTQSVSDDRSTFSGRLGMIRRVLDEAGPGALILLDEIGVGTDPMQGAALARSVLETLLEAGARVVATTHYTELKAMDDPRVRLAAVQARDGRPTYRLVPDVAGSSGALDIARRMGLPEPVLERAAALMDARARAMDEAVARLAVDRAELSERLAIVAEEERTLAEDRRRLGEKQAALRARRERLEDTIAKGFRARVRERESEVKALIAALQTDPSLRLAGASLSRIKQIRAEMKPKRPAPARPAPPPRPLRVGDRVEVPTLGRKGTITALRSRGRVEVDLGAMRMVLRAEEVGVAGAGPPRAAVISSVAEPEVAESEVSEPEPICAVRSPGNTCDLRGQRVEPALERVEAFLDERMLRGDAVAFVLHGHGTGALKTAVRAWLPSSRHAARWRPAGHDEGGDAFTVVELA